MNRKRLLPGMALLLAACSSLAPASRAFGPAEEILVIEDDRLSEVSGMGCSRRQPGVLWLHNDSGDAPRLFAVGPDGATLGTLEITNATARDWEEMVVFEIDGEPWILVADVGDNDAVRHDVVIYLLPEPDPAEFATSPTLQVEARVIIPYRYEDGPRDCEGVAVDVPNRRILLISKRTEPPVLYQLPLPDESPPPGSMLVAERLVPLVGIVPPTAAERAIPSRLGKYRAQVSAFDISPDNRVGAVLTYGNIYLYHRQSDETWEDAFSQAPERVPFDGLPQAESICFDGSSDTLLLSTEADQPPVLRLQRR